jgi:hypothetical protein
MRSSPNIKMIKSRKNDVGETCKGQEEIINKNKILVRKSERKRLLGILKHRRECNV